MEQRFQERGPEVSVSLIDGKPAGVPLVSVVIPVYNAAPFVHRAIESALAQTHRPLEIIVVDDGSTDETAQIVRRYPVTLLQQKNGGPGRARNAGVRLSRGEWIAFLDHDDAWHPEKTERQLACVESDVSAVFSAKDPSVRDVTFWDMYWRNLGGNPSSTIVRREVIIALGLFEEDRGMMGVDDYNFWLKFLWAGYRFMAGENLYDYTPDRSHLSGNPEKMLGAELLNVEKISQLAEVAPELVAERKRRLLLKYVPSLIYKRQLQCARRCLFELGFDRDAIRYWYAFLPGFVIDLKRALRSWSLVLFGGGKNL